MLLLGTCSNELLNANDKGVSNHCGEACISQRSKTVSMYFILLVD